MRLKVLGLVCSMWLGIALSFTAETVSAPASANQSVGVLLSQQDQLLQQEKSLLSQLASIQRKIKENDSTLSDIQKQLQSLETSKKQHYNELSREYGTLLVPVAAAFNEQSNNLQSIEQRLVDEQARLRKLQDSLHDEQQKLQIRHTEVNSGMQSNAQVIAATTHAAYREGRLAGLDLEKLVGIFSWPVPATKEVSSEYGWRELDGKLEFHSGIDIAADKGTPIHATADGTVLFAGPADGFGNWIVLKHEHGLLSIYGHMYRSGILVKQGQKVHKGDVIGQVGAAGQSYGPHLHYGVARGMTGDALNTVNPWVFLGN